MEFRCALERLRNEGLLEVVDSPASVKYEIAAYLKRLDGHKAVLFEKPLLMDSRSSPFRVAGGIATSKDTLSVSLGLDKVRELRNRIKKALKNPIKWRESEPKWIKTNMTIQDLPVLKHYVGEPGPYLTSSIVIFRDDSGVFSSSYHRMMPISDKRLVLRAVEGRKLNRTIENYERRKRELPVAVSIGSPVEVIIASAVPAENIDKIQLAGGISGYPVEMSRCEDVNAWAPSSSEIVLCGRILPEVRAPEGPFYEILGKDIRRMQPVLEIDSVYVREDPIYQAILPASREHEILMGLPVEPLIEDRVSEVVDVVDVSMTPGGAGWIEVAISIKKTEHDQPTLAGLMAISAHKSLKRVIIVDDDVDVSDYIEVLRAVLQRAHIPDDYKILSGIKGSSLDHSNLREIYLDGESHMIRLPQGKMIIDATKKGPKELMEKPKNPYI